MWSQNQQIISEESNYLTSIEPGSVPPNLNNSFRSLSPYGAQTYLSEENNNTKTYQSLGGFDYQNTINQNNPMMSSQYSQDENNMLLSQNFGNNNSAGTDTYMLLGGSDDYTAECSISLNNLSYETPVPSQDNLSTLSNSVAYVDANSKHLSPVSNSVSYVNASGNHYITDSTQMPNLIVSSLDRTESKGLLHEMIKFKTVPITSWKGEVSLI